MLMLTWNRLCWPLAFQIVSGAASAQSPSFSNLPIALPPQPPVERCATVPAQAAVGGVPIDGQFPMNCGSPGLYGLPYPYAVPMILVAPGMAPPLFGPMHTPPPFYSTGVGAAGPWPPPDAAPPQVPVVEERARPRRTDPARSSQLVTIGDRMFRKGDLRRAAERYTQAMGADPAASAPRVHLAQVALLRGQYVEAADRYREAMTVEPGWLVNAPDIQSIYGEPADFARLIARLETHLQVEPNDRDAWLVLGAQYYLSGRTRQASDIFLRLSDRKADATLAAFIDASTAHPPPR